MEWVPDVQADLCAMTADHKYVTVNKNRATVDQVNFIEHTDSISCVACHPSDPTMYATGSVDGVVRMHNTDCPSTLLCATSGAIRCLAFSSNGDQIAIGGESLRVTSTPITLLPHSSTSVHIACVWLEHRKHSNRLLSLTDDGHLRMYDVTQATVMSDTTLEMASWMKRDCLHTIRMGVVDCKGKEFVAVPSGSSVSLFEVTEGSLRIVMKIQSDVLRSPFSVSFMTHKKCIVADATLSVLLVFKTNIKKASAVSVDSIDFTGHRLQVVAGHGGYVVATTTERKLCTLKIPKTNGKSAKAHEELTDDENLDEVVKDLTKELGEEPLAKVRRGKRQPKANKYIDDEAEEGSDESEVGQEEEEDDGNVKNWVNNQMTGYAKAKMKPKAFRNPLLDDESEPALEEEVADPECEEDVFIGESEGSPPPEIMTPPIQKTHSLVPIGGTPVTEAGSYLCYNMTGFISKAGEHVTVHFHDVSALPVRIADHQFGFHAAALGPNGAIFASSTAISFKAFQSFGTNADWQVQFIPEEEVELVSIGLRFCVVSTSRYMRIFTHTGIEMAVVQPQGKVVCVTFSPQSKHVEPDLLAVTYCDPNTCSLRLVIYQVATQSEMTSCPLPVEELVWMGWSDDGYFYTADAKGVVRLLSSAWGTSWTPVYDRIHDRDSERYWLWGMSENAMMGHPLQHNEETYPTYGTVRGAVHVPFVMPVAHAGTEKEQVQREWVLRYAAKLRDLKQKAKCYSEEIARKDIRMDHVLFEMFCACVEDEQTARALDMSCTFELRATMEEAIRYCHAKQHTLLMEKLHAVLKHRFKRKRTCDLPDPGTEITEKEKDALFRKVVQWEKDRQKQHVPHAPAHPHAVPEIQSPPPAAGGIPLAKEPRTDPIPAPVVHACVQDTAPLIGAPLSKADVFVTPIKKTVVAPATAFKRIDGSSMPVLPSVGNLQNIVGAVGKSVVAPVVDAAPVQKFEAKRPTTVLRKKAPCPSEPNAPQPDVKGPQPDVKGGLGLLASAALNKRYREDDE